MFAKRTISRAFQKSKNASTRLLDKSRGGENRQTIDASSQPQEIQDAIAVVRSLVQKAWETKCAGCRQDITSDISIRMTFSNWCDNSRKVVLLANIADLTLCAKRCSSCSTITCLGCGQRVKRWICTFEDRQVNICCDAGYFVTVWMILSRYDMLFPIQLSAKSNGHKSLSPVVYGQLSKPSGTGYGSHHGSDYGSPGSGTGSFQGFSKWTSSGTTPATHTVQLKMDDAADDKTICLLLDLFTGLLASATQRETSALVSHVLKLSLVLDKAAEFLRNDSLESIERRSALLRSILNLLEKLGQHSDLRYLVTEERHAKTYSPGLFFISLGYSPQSSKDVSSLRMPDYRGGKDASLRSTLENLYQQSIIVLRSSDIETHLKTACEHIQKVRDDLVEPTYPFGGARALLTPAQQWAQFHKANSLTFSDAILEDFLPNLRIDAEVIAKGLRYARTDAGRNKRILSECASMKTSLDDGTFVIVAESRPDCMRALIVGPEDTAYAHGLFEFDILLPSSYPSAPPKMYLRYPNRVSAEINPNLHLSGMVCLSLLGTWNEGDATAKWQPGVSTILQVLVSVRAMVFTSDALHNEPVLEGQLTSGEILRYEEHVQCCVVRTAMLQWLRDRKLRDGVWRDLVKFHFVVRGDEILQIVRSWAMKNGKVKKWDGRLDFRLGGPRYHPGMPVGSLDLLGMLEEEVRKAQEGAEGPELARALLESLSAQ